LSQGGEHQCAPRGSGCGGDGVLCGELRGGVEGGIRIG